MILWLFVIILLVIIVLPAIVIIPQAFTSLNYFVYPIQSYSTKWVEAFFKNSEWVEGLQRSLLIASFTAILATVMGTMAAVAVNKFEFKGKSIIMSIMLAPMVIPVIVVGVSLYTSFSKVGLTNNILGLILSHTLIAMPMVFTTMLSGLSGVNENLELAALSMGSTPIGAFFKVVLPNVRSSVVASALFAFVCSLDEVVVSIFISGANTKTLPIVMWENMRTNINPTLAVAAVFMITLTLGMYIIQTIASNRSK